MQTLSKELLESLRKNGWIMATAESCTGGLIASSITDCPGSSEIFDRAFVTYSNEAKQEMLKVDGDLLTNYGAVSAEVAKAMASGVLIKSPVDIAVSCTGIAGPGGGTDLKPVGLVYIGVAVKNAAVNAYEHRFDGDRDGVRQQTVQAALKHMIDAVEAHNG